MNPDKANRIARQFEAEGYFFPINVFASENEVELTQPQPGDTEGLN